MTTEPGDLHVVGTGLLGTSVALAARRLGTDVTLEDASPTAAALARDLGAGRLLDDPPPSATDSAGRGATAREGPSLVVVATPPDVAAPTVAHALKRWPEAVVTDVASVKGAVLAGLERLDAPLERYVGSHPMAGREKSGAIAASADLFEGRAWVVVPAPSSRPEAVERVSAFARSIGAAVATMPAAEHDLAVAAVSHAPQVAASLVAARLRDLPDPALALSGQGLRDVTRIAASDPLLWTQILAGNAGAVRDVLAALVSDLQEVVEALDHLDSPDRAAEPGARAVLAHGIAAGNAGHARIPGKHGAAPTAYEWVLVLVPDRPGELARLLHDVGDAGFNLEDVHIEHSLGKAFGLAEISVVPGAGERLEHELQARGWRLHG